jgi:hypothetical protein
MLMPGEPGRLGTAICVFTVESPQPGVGGGGARHFMCAVTVETPRPVLGRHTHLLT